MPTIRTAVCLLAFSLAISPACGQDSGLTPAEQVIVDRQTSGNGIYVGQPKVYDDSVLVQMLQSASSKLAALQTLDAAGIAKGLGTVAGANMTTNSLGVNVGGPPTPSVATTAKGTDVSTTTTAPSFAAPTATAPAATTSMPSSFGVSASALLNEQMQLSYEIVNLRLLLEGSLNDRLVPIPGKDTNIIRPRATVGFPITLEPGKYKDAVAVVEMEVESTQDESYNKAEPPAVTSLLPREKTYNVASITDRSVSVGGGAVTQVMGGSFSFLHGHKTYFLVQDQDTLALQFPPSQTNRAGFLWQFRPVLGQRFPRNGMRQTFVQLTFPIPNDAASFGTVYVRSYWRKYDRKNGIVKDVIAGSLHEAKTNIPNLGMRQSKDALSIAGVEDIGSGQLLVGIMAPYMNGTSVRVGSTILTSGSTGFVLLPDRMQFTASAYDLATKKATILSRDGTETDLVLDDAMFDLHQVVTVPQGDPSLTTVDETNTLLQIRFVGRLPTSPNGAPYIVFVIGNKVFGYSDAPIRWRQIADRTMQASVLVPTSLLLANKAVEVRCLLAKTGYALSLPLPGLTLASKTETLVLIEQGKDYARFLLYGNRLGNLTVLAPSTGVDIADVGSPADPETLRLLRISAVVLKSYKQLVLQRRGDRPITLVLPTVDFKPAENTAAPKPKEKAPVAPCAKKSP